jgi:penicillin-binding protein 1B
MRLTKEQIFTMYANEVYLGQRGSFAIHGFGEGSTAQFGKDLSELTLPEAATLAGIIPAPNANSPSKHPDRATDRRNLILRAMQQRCDHCQKTTKRRNRPTWKYQLTADTTEAPTWSISFAKNY